MKVNPIFLAYSALAVAVILNIGANVTLKMASQTSGDRLSVLPLVLWGGSAAACYGAAFVLYGFTLRSLPMWIAYSTLVGATVLGISLFEGMTSNVWPFKMVLGGILILAGIIVLNR